MTGAPPSGTVTFLFTDVEGSTSLWQDHPREMARALARHDRIVRDAIEGNRGYVFSTAGDAFAAAFASAVDAVAAVSIAQAALSNEPWTDAVIRVRMGLHSGVADERDGDYFGPVLNRAARIMSLADGNQVLLSQATAELVRDQLASALELADVGEHQLKSLRRAEQLYQLMGPGLSSEQLDVAPAQGAGNLPPGVADFVGRRDDMEELRQMVVAGRVVTLTGIGGAGKTQLATRVAATLGPHHPDGVWWCDLTPLSSPEVIPAAIASAIGFVMQPDLPPVESVVDALSRRQMVLVLDNCEHLLDGIAVLVDALVAGCPDVALIATSREPIGTRTERVWPLQPLDAETEAVELLIQRAIAADATVDPESWSRDDLVELCVHLDGIPLAIEMAAARLRSMEPREVIDRLEDRFRVLRSRRRSTDQRHHTLLATLDWSYELLDADEQLFLDRLGVFAGSFDLATAEAICADDHLDEFDIADLLEALVEKSLVVPVRTQARTRFRLLETVRHYGLAHLDDLGDTASLRRRHALALANLVDDAAERLWGEQFWSGFQSFDDNWSDIASAISWSTSVGDGPLTGQLMEGCSAYGTSVPRSDLAELARAAIELPDPPVAAFGLMAFFTDGRQQIDYAEAGLARPGTTDENRQLLYSQRAAGRSSTGSGGTLAAVADARQAAYDAATPVYIAYWEAITAESTVRWKPEVAADHAEAAMRILDSMRRHPLSCAALGRLASYEALSGRLEIAFDLSEESTSLAEEAGFMVFGAWTVALSARILAVLDPPAAAPALAEAIESARQSGWWLNLWPVMSGAGRWFETYRSARTASVVDGYFEARGLTRSGYDLVPPDPPDLSTHVEHRAVGAAMSADEVVDFVLGELADQELSTP